MIVSLKLKPASCPRPKMGSEQVRRGRLIRGVRHGFLRRGPHPEPMRWE